MESCKGATDIFSPQFETNTSSSSMEDYPVELLVADMSHLQYALGEGYNPVLDPSYFELCISLS